jgi:hypothetical protein
MTDADRFKLLFGPYRLPKCRVGRFLRCRVKGLRRVKGLSYAPIPWPIAGGRHGCWQIIVCGSLVKAVQQESELAVAHHWGVSPLTVWTWQKALGVGATTPGTSRLRWDHFAEPWAEVTRQKAVAKARDPGRRANLAAARRGKPRPRHVVEAMAAGRRGKPHDAATRRKMSEAHRLLGTRPPALGPVAEGGVTACPAPDLQDRPPGCPAARRGRAEAADPGAGWLLALPATPAPFLRRFRSAVPHFCLAGRLLAAPWPGATTFYNRLQPLRGPLGSAGGTLKCKNPGESSFFYY